MEDDKNKMINKKMKQNIESISEEIEKEIMHIFKENLVSIVLFGSCARENHNENSDIDMIVVVNEYKEHTLSELRKYCLLNFEKKLDLHVFSKKDIIQNFMDFSPLFVTLLLGKKIFFDKEMFFEKTFRRFIKSIIRENINFKYCEGGKIWETKKIMKNSEHLL